MKFNAHSIPNEHAFLSGSSYHWINYTQDKLIHVYMRSLAVQKGVILHDFASRCIQLGQKLPRSDKSLNCFVNDAIGYNMVSEQLLYYSPYAFGTADAISYSKTTNILRIHDLKTGRSRPAMEQLEIYAALFCLEYDRNPEKIGIELRIYHSNNILVHIPDSDRIKFIMEKIVLFSKAIAEIDTLND